MNDTDANPAQLAPGYEQAAGRPIDEPYQGFAPFMHVGYSMNAAFFEGVQSGRY